MRVVFGEVGEHDEIDLIVVNGKVVVEHLHRVDEGADVQQHHPEGVDITLGKVEFASELTSLSYGLLRNWLSSAILRGSSSVAGLLFSAKLCSDNNYSFRLVCWCLLFMMITVIGIFAVL
jgi:hypothetical protein